MSKARLSLIAAVAVGLLAITTAGVSTWAWFQANSAATIEAESDEAEITVAAPDDFELAPPLVYAYKGNGTSGYTGAISDTGSDGTVTITDDFEEILGGDYTGETEEQTTARLAKFKVSNLWPGFKMTFAIALSGRNGTETFSGGSLILDSFYPGLDTNRIILNAGATATTSNYIAMAQAIKLYAGVSKTTTYTASANVIRSGVLNAGYFYKVGDATTNAHQTSKDYTIASGTVTGNPTTLYYYLTIEFSTDAVSYSSNPIIYSEYKQKVVNDTTTYEEVYETPSNWSSARYFKPDSTNGNDSCYEGLSVSSTKEFKITGLTAKAY